MIAGHLTSKNGYWYLILRIRDEHGLPKSKWIATHMKVNGNKRKAEAMLLEARRQYTSLSDMQKRTRDTLLSDYLIAWVITCKPKVAVSTYAGYKNCISRQIAPYFDQKQIKLLDLKPSDLLDYYDTLYARGLSGNTVLHYHVLLRKALEEAHLRELIPTNPADSIPRPRKGQFVANCYTPEECQRLLTAIKGDPLELPVLLSVLYGLRRSEVLGLKWGAIDFARNTLTISHSVVTVSVDGHYTSAGLSKALTNKDVKDITSEAIRYFSSQDFPAMCKQAKGSTKTDLYLQLKQQHPVAWAALEKLATTSAKAVDYPKVTIDKAFDLDNLDGDSDVAVESGKLQIGVYDGYTPEIEPPLKSYLKMLLESPNGVLVVDSLKSLTRNITKLLDILEFLLTRGLIFASTNYYLENGHVERRIKPLRAGHNTIEMQKNTSNLSGLGYRHKAALSHFVKSTQ